MDHVQTYALAKALYQEVPRRVSWQDASAETRMKWVLRARILGEQVEPTKPHIGIRVVQSLNGVAMAILGGALIVHQTYPDIVRQLLEKLPPSLAAAGLFAFGVAVHLALRRAKKG